MGMEPQSPRTVREHRQARTGSTLLGMALLLGAYRLIISDITVNSLLILPVIAVIAGTALLMRSRRFI